MISITFYIIIFILCLILSGFFSGCEVIILNNKGKVRTLVNENERGSDALDILKKTRDRFLITILIGIISSTFLRHQ